jgi:hypothetical protein
LRAFVKPPAAASQGLGGPYKGLNVAFEGLNAAFQGLYAAFKGRNAALQGLNAAFKGLDAAFEALNAAFEGLYTPPGRPEGRVGWQPVGRGGAVRSPEARNPKPESRIELPC